MARAAGFTTRSETVHQAAAQIVSGGGDYISLAVGDIFRTQRQPCYVGVSIYEPGHKRLSGQIDQDRAVGLQRVCGDCLDPIAVNEDIESSLQTPSVVE